MSATKNTKAPTAAETDETIQAQRAKFLEDRQAALDAERDEDDGEERETVTSSLNQPPAARASDGGLPGEKEIPVLKKAEQLEGEAQANKAAKKKAQKEANKAAKGK